MKRLTSRLQFLVQLFQLSVSFWGCFLSLTLPISSEAWKHIVFLADNTWNCLFRWPIKRNFTLNKFDSQKIKLAKCNIEGGGQLQQKCILYNTSVYTWQKFISILCSLSPETSVIPLFSVLLHFKEMSFFLWYLPEINYGRSKIAKVIGFGVRPFGREVQLIVHFVP